MKGVSVLDTTGQAHQNVIEEWIRRYGDKVLRLCALWLRDVHLAEDATQETFLKAWKALPRFVAQNAQSEQAFIMAIAANTCRDLRRGAWFRHVDRSLQLSDLPPQIMAVSDEDRSIYLTILAMPEKHRQVILLYYYAGLTLKECGQALGLRASSVHHRLKQAEAHLKTQLEGGLSHA